MKIKPYKKEHRFHLYFATFLIIFPFGQAILAIILHLDKNKLTKNDYVEYLNLKEKEKKKLDSKEKLKMKKNEKKELEKKEYKENFDKFWKSLIDKRNKQK